MTTLKTNKQIEALSRKTLKDFLDSGISDTATEQDKKEAEDIAYEIYERNHDYSEALNELR